MGRRMFSGGEFERNGMWFLKEATRLLQQAVKLMEKEQSVKSVKPAEHQPLHHDA